MTDSLVAFLDVLGCTAIAVKGTEDEKSRLLAFLGRVNDTYLSSQGVVVRNLGVGHQVVHNPEVFACSDSILLSANVQDPIEIDKSHIINNLLSKMVSIYWQGLHAGFLIRGGVARGECLHRANQIFGEAYVKSVKLEKETCFPRIELDPSIFSSGKTPILDSETKSLCVEEVKGHYYLNCLAWHQGVWMDYMYFKFGVSEWPQDVNSEIRQGIEGIEKTIDLMVDSLRGSPQGKWMWFRDQWREKKTSWPIFAQQGSQPNTSGAD